MTGREIRCPNCGAPHQVRNPGLVMLVCEYCGRAVYWDEESVRAAGTKALLPEGFTRLYRGAAGAVRGRRFVVVGRVRYSFGRGFWDEWYLELDAGATAWLTEDNHELCLERPVAAAVPAFDAVGRRVEVDGLAFVVEEKGEAECVGAEGQLPFVVEIGEKYKYLDGSSPDGKHSLGIEYDRSPASVFVGEWLAHEDLALDDEGEDW